MIVTEVPGWAGSVPRRSGWVQNEQVGTRIV